MAEIQDPRTGIWYDFVLGYTTWKTKMDSNLKLLGLMQQFAVIDRNLTAPPGSPADGDSYIPASTASGLWVGEEGNIAIWIAADSAWTFLTPNEGWLCYIADEDVVAAYNGSIWTKGIPLTNQKSVIDRNLTAPPGGESDGDAYIPASTASGSWVGEEGNIAIYSSELAAYYFITPVVGDVIYVVDEEVLAGYNGSIWTKGIPLIDQKSVIDDALTAPPGGESDGDAYIPASVATGSWAGHEDEIAIYSSELAAYYFLVPDQGHTVYEATSAIWIGWNGSAWVAV